MGGLFGKPAKPAYCKGTGGYYTSAAEDAGKAAQRCGGRFNPGCDVATMIQKCGLKGGKRIKRTRKQTGGKRKTRRVNRTRRRINRSRRRR